MDFKNIPCESFYLRPKSIVSNNVRIVESGDSVWESKMWHHTITRQVAHGTLKKQVRTKLHVEQADMLAKFLRLFQTLKEDFTDCVPGVF